MTHGGRKWSVSLVAYVAVGVSRDGWRNFFYQETGVFSAVPSGEAGEEKGVCLGSGSRAGWWSSWGEQNTFRVSSGHCPGGFLSGVGTGAGELRVALWMPLLFAVTQAPCSHPLAGRPPPLTSAHPSTQDF